MNSPRFLLVLYLAVIISGKLDEEHTDKHNKHHFNVSYPDREQHKAYHDHDDLFGAKMCKNISVPFADLLHDS